MDKKSLRQETLAFRRGLSAEQVREKSRAIHNRLRGLRPFRNASAVLAYIDSKDNEVQTRPLLLELFAEGRTVLAPITGPNRTMQWSRLESLDELAPSRFGILEPRDDCRRIVSAPTDSIALVPGIGFTTSGARIGYGGGYYDCFLKDYAGATAALAFEIQLIPPFPLAAHDIRVRRVVTESLCYRQ